MKLKCKLLLSSVFALSIVFLGSNTQAQHNHKHPHGKKIVAKHHKAKAGNTTVRKNNVGQSMKVIKRTNHVIVNAYKSVQKYKVHSGDLSKAVRHQQYAKKLLRNNKTHRAMQHSRLARKHAFVAIRTNKGTLDRTYELNKEEKLLVGEPIADLELEKELKANTPKIKFDDSAVTEKEMTELETLKVAPSDYKNE